MGQRVWGGWDLKESCLLSPAGSQPRGAAGKKSQCELLEDFRAQVQPAARGTLTGLPVSEWEADGGGCATGQDCMGRRWEWG